jgi:hypothetical protein
MARVLGESLVQLLAGPAMRDAIGRNILVEGVVEESPCCLLSLVGYVYAVLLGTGIGA